MKRKLSDKKQQYPPQDNILPSERSRLNKKVLKATDDSGEQEEPEEKLSVGNSQDARWQSAREHVVDQEAFYEVYDERTDSVDSTPVKPKYPGA